MPPGRVSDPVVQRDGPGGATSVPFRGQILTKDTNQLKTMLGNLISTRGQDEATTFAYGFLRMDAPEKFRLQAAGIDPQLLADVQAAFEPVLDAYKKEHEKYLEDFGPSVVADTTTVLNKSKELLQAEEKKYEGDVPESEKPDLDAIRTAAKALAAKRRLADAAGAKAHAAHRAVIDQNVVPAGPTSPFPQPIVPYFPNPELRDKAYQANDAWWKLEKEYGELRVTHEKKFPVLAMYSSNEDGEAAGRLEDLPTWGPLADYRMKNKILAECQRRIGNVVEAQNQLDVKKAWQLRKMVDASLKAKAATPYQQRWVHDHAAKLAKVEAEEKAFIAGVAIAVVVVTAVATGGAALAVEGTLAAGLFSSLAAVGGAVGAGVSIATAYEDLREYQFQKASRKSALDQAESIASDAGEPSLVWVAVELLAAGFEVGAAATAFKTAAKAVKSVHAGQEVVTSLRAIEGAAGGGATKIITRTLEEAEASGVLQKAIVAEGKKFSEAGLSQMGDLISQGLGRTWAEEFALLKQRGKVLPFTQEGLEGALGKKTAQKLMGETGYEKTIGMYHLDTGKAFVRPAAEGDLAASIVHEMTHAIQGPQRGKYANFIREFEAYAAQREMMRHLNRTYGWQPKSSAWLMEATDWQVAKHIRLEYGYTVPHWVLEEPLAAKQLDKAFAQLTKRLATIP